MEKFFNTPLLFTPGPTPTPEFIRMAMGIQTIHHRTKEFEAIFEIARKKFLKLIAMHECIFLASSGTGAMEASLINFSKNKVLIINSGKFGERFVEIAKSLKRKIIEIEYEWDTPADITDITDIKKSLYDIDCICFQICESSGGVLHPYEKIAKKIKEINKDIFVIVDAITALGVDNINVENIDVLIGGSQKAFMLPSGLSMIGLSQKAVNFLNTNKNGYYFDLSKELKNQNKNTTAYTPATSLIIGLKAYFDMLEQNNLSINHIFNQTKKYSCATKEALKAMGLKIYPKVSSNSMSVIYHDRSEEIRKKLKEKFQINLAGGQDRLKNKIFRINHMGLIPLSEISFVINAIELSLHELGIIDFKGIGNSVFFKNLLA